jgi:hypothetical protein
MGASTLYGGKYGGKKVIDTVRDNSKASEVNAQVNYDYFDRYVKQAFEKPTVGILLCKEKNNNVVLLTLSEDANIYAERRES